MAAHEAELRAILKLPVSLIARVTTKSAPRPGKAAAKRSQRKTVARPAKKRVKR
jgi:hypothetical protein